MPPATSPPPDATADDQRRPPEGPEAPGPHARPGEVALRPIGHVRTAYKDMADTPIQTSRNPHEPGRVVVLDDYAAGLDGLDGFDLLDGTPVLDIKPFEPHLDVPGYQAGSGWLDQVRGGWYQRIDAAANPLVRPGRQGLRAAGLLDPGSVSDTAGERG